MTFTTGTNYVEVGDHTPRWTGMGAMAVSLYRYHDGLSDTEVHVSDEGACGADANYSNDYTNDETYIRFGEDTCSTTGLTLKFVAAHEWGHSYGFQFANSGHSPSSATHAVTPDSCGFANPNYSFFSKEWSSIAAKEGWAHFVSAKVWNNKASDGQFRFGSSLDLERWDSGNTAYGRTYNVCCDDDNSSCENSLDGASTNGDWMRGLWDMYTNNSCSNAPSLTDMTRLYSELVNSSGLSNSNNWSKSQSAVDTLITQGHIGSTCDDLWDEAGCHNGMHFTGQSLPPAGC